MAPQPVEGHAPIAPGIRVVGIERESAAKACERVAGLPEL